MKPGDVALYRPHNTVGRVIAAVTRSPYCHTRLITDTTGATVEADFGGVIRGHVQDGDVIVSPPLTDAERNSIPAAAEGLVGTPYGLLDIVVLGLSRLGVRVPWLSKHVLGRPTHLFCSQLVDLVWQAVGYHAFTTHSDPEYQGTGQERLPQEVTPGDIADKAFVDHWPVTTYTEHTTYTAAQ